MKRSRVCQLVILTLLAMALPMTAGHAQSLETDAEIFALCCDAAGFVMPEGASLEGFRREDINGDGVIDAAVVLRQAGGSRRFVLFMSGEAGYRIVESDRALPSVPDGGQDSFVDMEVQQGSIVLHVDGGNGQRYKSQYTFTAAADSVRLSALSSVVWNAETNEAVQNRFDFVAGEHSSVTGRMQGDGFQPEGVDEPHTFAANAYGSDIEGFDVDGFPVTWEAFQSVNQDADLVQCTLCQQWFDSEAFAAHVCAAPESGLIYCDVCGGWFAEGDAFRNHACTGKANSAQCALCGQVFDNAQALSEHQCSAEKRFVTCDICGGSFEEGAAFRNHACVTYPAQGTVYCDICGNSYEEGDAFRNHVCVPRQGEQPPVTLPQQPGAPQNPQQGSQQGQGQQPPQDETPPPPQRGAATDMPQELVTAQP